MARTQACHRLRAAISRRWSLDRIFESDSTHAEPRGYLCATQTPDGIIHLLSSRLHYRFNLAWLLEAKMQ